MHDCIFSECEIASRRQLCEREKKRERIYANLETKSKFEKRLNLKLRGNKRLDSKDVKGELNDH